MAVAIFLLSCIAVFVLIGLLIEWRTPRQRASQRVTYGIEEDGTGNSDVGGS